MRTSTDRLKSVSNNNVTTAGTSAGALVPRPPSGNGNRSFTNSGNIKQNQSSSLQSKQLVKTDSTGIIIEKHPVA